MVIGLDGLGLAQARDLAGSGVMPNLAGLMDLGQVWATPLPIAGGVSSLLGQHVQRSESR
jgi:hypothetical protein